jgi:hypothetical protein
MTSSAPFGPEVQKFYNREEENQNNIIAYFNCSAHCISNDRSCCFRSQGFQFDIPVRTPVFSVEICDCQQSVSVLANAANKPRPLPSTPFPVYYYHLIKRNCKQSRIYQVKIRNRGCEKNWKYNIKVILVKLNMGK